MDNMLRGGGGGSMNYRPIPRRQDYYGSSSRNTRTRSMGPRSMSNYNWDVGEDESTSIDSYESVNKPLGYPPSNSFDRSRNYGGDYRPGTRWLAEQESRDSYRNIGPNHVRSSSQLDGHASYYGRHISQFENRDRYDIEVPRDLVPPRQHPRRFSNSRVLEGIDEFDQDPFPKRYYSPRGQEAGFTGIRERSVFDSRERWPSNRNFDTDGLRNKKPRKLVSPIAGAAPILICSNCSILVVLPRRLRIVKNGRAEIQCGSCSAVMLIEVDGTRIRVSTIVKEKEYFPVIGQAGPADDSATAAIDDPTEAIKLKCKALIASAVGFSSHGYTDEHLIEKEEITDESRTLNPRQNKEISTAISELEVSHVEYPVTGFSQDSAEVNKEDDCSLRPKERNRPIFVGINEGDTEEKPRSTRNESFDSVRGNEILEDHQPKVVVNGQPIPDFAVKNAEIMVGPILPGNYWYDYTAGFWGVMNYPCLGIIPPLIEEFNYMMPERCAAGNTGVFVNGRELHQRDLDLLASRGLPTTKYMSYTVHISGKVFDERTGEELYEYDLGKLAPSVENAKRGFGMRVPNGLS